MKRTFNNDLTEYQNEKRKRNNHYVESNKPQTQAIRKKLKTHKQYNSSNAHNSKNDEYAKVKSKLINYTRDAPTAFSNFKNFLDCKHDLIAYTNNIWHNKTNMDYTLKNDIPKKNLEKDGSINKSFLLSLIMKLKNTEVLKNEYPFYMRNMERNNIIQAPKSPIFKMSFPVQHSDNTEHYIVRQLVECKMDDKTQLLAYDTTFYRGLPKTTSYLTLFVNGHMDGTKQLLRLDTCGMFDEKYLIANCIDYKIPQTMKSLYRSTHNNLINTRNKEFYKPVIKSKTHLHTTDSDFDLYAAAYHMCFKNKYSESSRKLGNELSKYNCIDIEVIKNQSQKLAIAKENNGIIPFKYLEECALTTFGLEKCELTPEFIDAIEEYRKPNSKINLDKFNKPKFKNELTYDFSLKK